MNKIAQINYDPILEATTSSTERWTSSPISMICRINILKMNILPKFLFLFQNIPYPLPHICLLELRNCLPTLFGKLNALNHVLFFI